jgi:YVTN family beta-propeller protein
MKPYHYTTNLVITAVTVLLLTTTCFGWNAEQSVAPASVIIELLALNRDIATPVKPKYLSPTDLAASPDSSAIYVAEQTAKQIAVVDLATKSVKSIIKLPSEVTGIAVAPDGKKLYATCSSDLWPSGMVCEVDLTANRVTRRLPAGQGARSPVLSHDGKTLYVCNRFGNDIYVDDVASGALIKKIPVLREPYAAAITPDDSVLVVTNAFPIEKATDTLNIGSKILLIDARAGTVRDTLRLPIGSNSVFGVTISPDGLYAFATHIIDNSINIPATRIDGGWIHTNNCAIVDIKNRKILNDVALDLPVSGAANPWGVACSRDGKMLCVAHSGRNMLSVVDSKKIIDVAGSRSYHPDYHAYLGTDSIILWHDLMGIANITDRILTKGKSPRAIITVGNKAITAGYFDDYLEVFDLALPGSGTKSSLTATIQLGPEVQKTSERKGEIAFYDASICLQYWHSCHSCHPFGRTDGFNWTLNTEIATPKNSKSMIYSWWTPPTSSTGKRAGAWESIRAAMQIKLFLQPDPLVAACLDTFFMSMKPVPSPHLVKGTLSETGKKGRELFMQNTKLDCKICHSGPLFTDMKFHNAGIRDPYDATTQWDTPSLIEAWRTGPYNHLGSCATIGDHIKDKGHSNASELSQEDFNALVEYILSL